jgi:hypothetical protein
MGNTARIDINPMPESTLSPSQGLLIWPQGIQNVENSSTASKRHSEIVIELLAGFYLDAFVFCYSHLL